MAELVLAACASHAPMMASAREAAPVEQADRFFAAMAELRGEVERREVDVIVVLSNEHFTNFFLENFPQVCIGVGERNHGPAEPWLGIPQGWVPGRPDLAMHLTERLLGSSFDPAFSYELDMDHGIMTVVHELDPAGRLAVIPIVQNCAVPPLMPVRRAYEMGIALGEAIRSHPSDLRVALVAAGGLSHWVGHPRVGDIDEEFDRWFLGILAAGEAESVLDLPDDEIVLAGNGAHEIRSWLGVAGAMAPGRARVLAYEPITAWITGMGVVLY
jgi:hypothetical protein